MKMKNKRMLAYILVALGVLSLLFMAKSMMDKYREPEVLPNEPEKEDTAIIPSEDDEGGAGEGTGEKDENSTSQEQESKEKVTFSKIQSVLKYNIHSEIEAFLDVEKFDSELTAFLLEKGAIFAPSDDDDMPEGIFLVTSSDYLTRDLRRNVYIFDLKLDNEARSLITVSVDGNGNFAFDIN